MKQTLGKQKTDNIMQRPADNQMPKTMRDRRINPITECTTNARRITDRLPTAQCSTSVRNAANAAKRLENLPENIIRLQEHVNDSKRQPAYTKKYLIAAWMYNNASKLRELIGCASKKRRMLSQPLLDLPAHAR